MNPLTLATLRRLSASGFRSGQDIARELGVTRATVWNAIQEAEGAGLAVEKVRGRGYRLRSEPVWLDAAAITAALGGDAASFRIEVAESVASTNSVLLERGIAALPSGTVLVAELQTAGRGRRGRTWLSGLGGALTFSLLWRFDQGVAGLSGLSLVVGLACAEGLEAAGAREVGVKWPNDLQFGGGKLGGILIELQGDALGPSAAVIGIGINVTLPEFVARSVGQPVADIAQAGGSRDRNTLLAHVLRSLAGRIGQFAAGGFAPLEPDFRRRHVLEARDVDVAMSDGRTVSGRVEGVEADGSLRVRTEAGPTRFHGGEVSVRGRAA